MERLVEGPITLNPSSHVEHCGLYSLGYVKNNAESLDEYNMPFLQMLQSPPLLFSTEPNFHNTQMKCAPEKRKKRKRKRARQKKKKNKEEAESQRMTHIAVERNRRRQMNEHLSTLRSLVPTSYVQRGHQASIIGGAIGFVRDLERVLSSLEDRKRARVAEEGGEIQGWWEVRVVQERVNLKVQCRRRSGQLLRAIVALEQELRLTVMHLDIMGEEDTVLYSFDLKIENECGVGSVEQIEAAVQQIFSLSNTNAS